MERTSPILCLGEVIADLICDRPFAAGEASDRLVPYPGGALANVAVAVARAGFPAALAGGVGTDVWGEWLARRLEEAGVSTRWLARLERVDTPVGIALLDQGGEPAFQIYGEHIGATMSAAADHLPGAVAAAEALVVGSNTMVGPVEREVTRRAVELTTARGRPILFDPNFRPNRWQDPEPPRAYCIELARSANVIKCNRSEAELMTGEADPLAAARRLATGSTGLVVVTDGKGPVLTAGAVEAGHRPEPVGVVSPLGAGDAFMGALAAGLASLDWDLARADELLPAAASAAGRACTRLGAQ